MRVETCEECPSHSHSEEGSAEIADCVCNMGYTGPDGSACSACVAGRFKSANGSVSCAACPEGKYSNRSAATSEATCAACPPWSYSAQGNANVTDCVCVRGYSGPDGGPCIGCRPGSFKQVQGSGACLACLPGTFSAQIGGSNCSACPVFSHSAPGSANASNCTCNRGYAGSPGARQPCTACGRGEFQAANGSCTRCAVGTYSGAAAAVNCSVCPNQTRSSDNRSACVAIGSAAAVAQAQAVAAALSAVVGAVVAAAVAGAVAGGGGGGGGGGAAQLVEQAQFMSIVGSVGGASASAGNSAFSDGFQWANFDLLPSDGQGRQRRQGSAAADPYACGATGEGSVVAALLQRFATMCAILMVVFLVRASCCRLHMWWYPDSPSPPDMALPGWEGPVLVAQLFGMSDKIVPCFLVDCWSWRILAVLFFLCGPFAFFCLSVYKVHALVARNRSLKSAGLVFNDSPAHSFKDIASLWSKDEPLSVKLSQAFVYVMDIRFRGGWVKKDADAKFWGFLMGAYTDRFWLIVGWVLVKKIIVALNKHLLDGGFNAAIAIAIFSVDLVVFLWKLPFRDNLVNLSQTLAATSNLLAVVLAAIPAFVPPEVIPAWFYGPVVIIVTTVGTGFLTLAAAVDPVLSLLGATTTMMGQLSKCCGAGGLVGNTLGTVRNILWVRFQMIFLRRSKAAAMERVKKAQDAAASHGDENKREISPLVAALAHQVRAHHTHVRGRARAHTHKYTHMGCMGC